jgi:hypothetical protein
MEKIAYSQIENLIKSVNDFYTQPDAATTSFNRAKKAAHELLYSISDIMLIIGSGYPHYVRDTNNIYPTEFKRFFNALAQPLQQGDHKPDELWKCSDCLRNKPPGINIKQFCQNCADIIPFQPIDLLRLILDVDLICVLPTFDNEILTKIRYLAERKGWTPPEEDIVKIFHHSQKFVSNPTINSQLLHPDIYVTTEDQIHHACRLISQGKLPEAKINMLGYHGDWVPVTSMIATDLYGANYYPLAFRDHSLANQIPQAVAKFTNRHPSPQDAVATYMNFLKEYDGKNFRILDSDYSFQTHTLQIARKHHRII